MNDKREVYKITFNKYTDGSRGTVAHRTDELSYLDVEDGFCLVRGDQLSKISQFGEGINTATYLGKLVDLD